MRLSTVTPAASEPISISLARSHLRLETDGGVHPDDDLITSVYIPAARDYIERHTGRRMITQTLLATMPGFPASIDLPVVPVASVSSIAYYDSDNSSQTLSASAYALDADEWGARIVLNDGFSWPSVYSRPDAVRVTFVAGASTVAPGLLHAMLILLGHAYENREAVVDAALEEMPYAVQSAIGTYALRLAV